MLNFHFKTNKKHMPKLSLTRSDTQKICSVLKNQSRMIWELSKSDLNLKLNLLSFQTKLKVSLKIFLVLMFHANISISMFMFIIILELSPTNLPIKVQFLLSYLFWKISFRIPLMIYEKRPEKRISTSFLPESSIHLKIATSIRFMIQHTTYVNDYVIRLRNGWEFFKYTNLLKIGNIDRITNTLNNLANLNKLKISVTDSKILQ